MKKNSEEQTDPDCLIKAFEHFETVYACLNEFYYDFGSENWRAQVAWRNVQDFYRSVRMALIKKVA